MGISEYLDWIKLSPRYLLALALASSFLLVAPENTIKTVGLDTLVTEYRPWIGLVAILSFALLVAHGSAKVAPLVADMIMKKRLIGKCKEYLKQLTPQEKLILSDYILRQTKTRKLDIKDGVVNGLANARIIYQAASVGTLYGGWARHLGSRLAS